MLTQLENGFRIIARHNLFLAGQLVKLLDLFNSHNIPTIPLKGPLLALSAYGDLGLRQYADLDLLVRQSDVVRVKTLLVSEGFRPWADLSEAAEKFHLAYAHAYTFFELYRAYAVDIHWDIAEKLSPLRFGIGHLWQRVQTASLAGTQILCLPPEDTLLTLCVNGSRNYWEQLKLICDVSEFIRRHAELDWATLFARARSMGSERMLLLGLLLAKNLLDTNLPEGVVRIVQANRAAVLAAERVCSRLLYGLHASRSVFESMVFFIGVRERLPDKLRWLASTYWLAPNAKDRSFLPLPRPLSFLYYLIRPIRLAKDCWPELLRR